MADVILLNKSRLYRPSYEKGILIISALDSENTIMIYCTYLAGWQGRNVSHQIDYLFTILRHCIALNSLNLF